MNKRISYLGLISCILLFTSCYNNKQDISQPTASSIDEISFVHDVVPIVTSGSCGCHNNGGTSVVQFSHLDTVFYSVISARSTIFGNMANGTGVHPGGGGVAFTPSQAAIISEWVAQGAKDDYAAPAVTGSITYTTNIVPIYQSVCKGGSCHGGLGPVLDYAILVSEKSVLSTMMASAGASGHPGGTISLDQSTTSTFLAWIAQGMKQ